MNAILISFLLLLNYPTNEGTNTSLSYKCHTKKKTAIARFEGGKIGSTILRLYLYSDSTYLYTSQMADSKKATKDKGTYYLTTSTLTLTSKKTIKNQLFAKKSLLFNSETYRITQKQLLLYSEEQERADNFHYLETYLCLYRIDD